MKTPKKDNPFTKARLDMQAREKKKLNKAKALERKEKSTAHLKKEAKAQLSKKTIHGLANVASNARTYKKTYKILSILGYFRYVEDLKPKSTYNFITGSNNSRSQLVGKTHTSGVKVAMSWKHNKDSLLTGQVVLLKKSKQKWFQKYNRKTKINVNEALRSSPLTAKKKKSKKLLLAPTNSIQAILYLLRNRVSGFDLVSKKNTTTSFKKTKLFHVFPRSYYTLYLASPTTLFATGGTSGGLRCLNFNNCISIYWNSSNHYNLSFLDYLKYTKSQNTKNRYLNLLRVDYGKKAHKLPSKETVNSINQARVCYWDGFYNALPLSAFMDKKVTIINYNIANVLFEKDFAQLLKRALRYFPFMQLNRIAAKLIASIFSILVLKDSKALSTFIQTIMQKEHYKKHNMYFGFAGQLVTDVLNPWLHHFNCLGVSITFRGKLAVGGNSRKRALKYKAGMLSSSSKYIKVNRTFAIVRTKTGSVGFVVTVAW